MSNIRGQKQLASSNVRLSNCSTSTPLDAKRVCRLRGHCMYREVTCKSSTWKSLLTPVFVCTVTAACKCLTDCMRRIRGRASTRTIVGATDTSHRFATCEERPRSLMKISCNGRDRARAYLWQVHSARNDNTCGRVTSMSSRCQSWIVVPQSAPADDNGIRARTLSVYPLARDRPYEATEAAKNHAGRNFNLLHPYL